jgi:DNA (cytosine-5)-methyltransferase 1
MQWPPEIAPTIDAHFGNKQGLENQHINGEGGCLPLVSKCLITKNRMDAETETLIPTTGGHFNSYPVLQPIVVDRAAFNQGENAQYKFRAEHSETMDSLVARGPHAVLQPIPIHDQATRHAGKNGEKTMGKGNGLGVGHPGEPMNTLTKGDRHAVAQPIAFSGQMSQPQTNVGITQTLQAKNPMAVAVGVDTYNGTETGQVSCTITADVGGPTHSGPKVMQAMAVRRLTPVECERLQGFGDNYTDIKSKGKPTPDGPRYKALGNSMAVPVMAWIGQRIEQVEAICKQNK